MDYLIYGLPILWGIIILAMLYFALAGRTTPLGFLATLFLCAYVLAMIVLPAPWTVFAGPLIFLHTFVAPFWYVPAFFILLLTLISALVAFSLKRRPDSLVALLSFSATIALFYAGFSAYLTYEIPRAQAAADVKIVCQSRKSTLDILLTSGFRESGPPHALIRTQEEAYIYSFSERRFVEIPTNVALYTPCHP
ncbi:MAG: hypothetical protein AAGI14_07545 [Pseudomonadota bacterium]